MKWKAILFIFFLLTGTGIAIPLCAQQPDTIPARPTVGDTPRTNTVPLRRMAPSTAPSDSESPLRPVSTQPVQAPATPRPGALLPSTDTDSASTSIVDSTVLARTQTALAPDSLLTNTNKTTDRVLERNTWINTSGPGIFFIQELRTHTGKEFLFYVVLVLFFILALFKTFYPLYFQNLFRIYFNTSLRQSQLTDQLSQAVFPSFVLNLFYTFSAGIYIWLLFQYYNKVQALKPWMLLVICIISVIFIYLVKFIILKFTGWLAGIQQTISNYIFIIFLVNKITGILLLPFIVLLAFSQSAWIPSVAVISFLLLGLLFLSRYVKSYGTLERKIIVQPFHLLIFVLGAEIVPLLIFYKIVTDYLV